MDMNEVRDYNNVASIYVIAQLTTKEHAPLYI